MSHLSMTDMIRKCCKTHKWCELSKIGRGRGETHGHLWKAQTIFTLRSMLISHNDSNKPVISFPDKIAPDIYSINIINLPASDSTSGQGILQIPYICTASSGGKKKSMTVWDSRTPFVASCDVEHRCIPQLLPNIRASALKGAGSRDPFLNPIIDQAYLQTLIPDSGTWHMTKRSRMRSSREGGCSFRVFFSPLFTCHFTTFTGEKTGHAMLLPLPLIKRANGPGV